MADSDLAPPAEASREDTPGGSLRIVVVAPPWIGDTVMAQSLFKALHQGRKATIDVIAPSTVVPVLARMSEVRNTIRSPFVSGRLQLGARYRLARSLSGSGYDQAIVLPNSWKSALVPYLAGIPLRTGYVGEQRWGLLNDLRRLDPVALPMTVQRFVALAGNEDFPIEPDAFERPELNISTEGRTSTMATLGIDPEAGPVLVLCPGAEYGPSKRWPAKYYAKLAESKLKEGWQVWLLGSPNDVPIALEISNYCDDKCVDLTGRTSLEQAIDILSLARTVVSNDSGLMHVTAALRRPQVALFGSSDPTHTPALSTRCRTEYLGLSCSPCFERDCPLEHHNCLQQLSPERVLDAVNSISQGEH